MIRIIPVCKVEAHTNAVHHHEQISRFGSHEFHDFSKNIRCFLDRHPKVCFVVSDLFIAHLVSMKFTAVCVVALLACQAYAWGPIGHEVAAAIAMKHLSSAAVSQLQDILSAEKGAGDLVQVLNGFLLFLHLFMYLICMLYQVANWADQVRSQSAYKWSAPLHFINTPDWECAFTPDQDCSDNMCVSGAIGNYSSRVVSMDGDEADEAAKFITHFCGSVFPNSFYFLKLFF
jgi:hypothetical protein